MVDKNDYSAQSAILGTMMYDGPSVGAILAEMTEEDYTVPEYKLLFTTIKKLFADGKPTGPVMVRSVVGMEYDGIIRKCCDNTVFPEKWRVYAETAKEQSRLCRLEMLARSMFVCNSEEQAQEFMAKANEIFGAKKASEITSISQGLVDFWDRQDTKKEYIKWGFDALDSKIYADKGDFIILGGRPSAGKTLLALNFADYMSQSHKVGFFSLETTPEKIFDRFFSQHADVDFTRLKKHTLEKADEEKLLKKTGEIQKRKLDVIRANSMSVADIAATTLAHKYEIIFVDYVQLVRGKGNNRTEEVANISRGLHNLAQRNGITVVALAQLSRPETGAAANAPTMQSLKESGQLEQDADSIMLLYQSNPANLNSDRVLKIAKNKEGQIGAMTLQFLPNHQKFKYIPINSSNASHS